MTGSVLPGWPWRAFAASLALACIGLGLFADAPPLRSGEGPSDSTEVLILPDTISIRVLNGSGAAGLARRVQRFFQGSTGEAVWVAPGPADDADRDDYLETIIVSHDPDISGARAAASLLGLPGSCIVWELGGDPGVDLTIILGRDVAMGADTLIPFSEP